MPISKIVQEYLHSNLKRFKELGSVAILWRDVYELPEVYFLIPENVIISTQREDEWGQIMGYLWDMGIDVGAGDQKGCRGDCGFEVFHTYS